MTLRLTWPAVFEGTRGSEAPIMVWIWVGKFKEEASKAIVSSDVQIVPFRMGSLMVGRDASNSLSSVRNCKTVPLPIAWLGIIRKDPRFIFGE